MRPNTSILTPSEALFAVIHAENVHPLTANLPIETGPTGFILERSEALTSQPSPHGSHSSHSSHHSHSSHCSGR